MDVLRDSFPVGLGELPKLDRLFGTFVSRELETAFQKDYFDGAVRKYLRFSISLSVIAFLAYGIHDLLVIPEIRLQAWAIRYGVAGPIGALLVAYVMRYQRWELHQSVMLVFGMTLNLVVLWIGCLSSPGSPGFFIYSSFAIVFITAGPFIARMNVKTQCIYTLLTVVLFNVLCSTVSHAPAMIRVSLNLTFMTMGAIGTLAARELEFQARLGWLQKRVIREQMAALDAERQRSESLLLNVLPRRIAERLKKNPGVVIADAFETATVLFSDIVGFTELSARLSPDELVRRLDEVFSRFDQIADELELEKIKTIGDAYMVAGGIPARREDHAAAVCEMALRMREALATIELEEPIAVRVGVHTGPVVAGVIGKKKFIYDVWGDTVNTASRMESHSVPGSIQVSESTYQATKDRFEYECRGVVSVKGKGEMTTYFLLGRRELAAGRLTSLPELPVAGS